MERDISIDYDLENFPLYIKTDSEFGEDEKIRIHFQKGKDNRAGGVEIEIKSSPTYLPLDCKNAGDQMPLLTDLPSAAEKIWRIMVTKNSDIRLLVHCNDVKVVDALISESTCVTAKFENWSKEVKKIKFHSFDTASDFYISSPPPSEPITPGIVLRIT